CASGDRYSAHHGHGDLEDRQVHRDHDGPHHAANDDHDEGLDQAADRVDGVVDLFLIELGDLVQHRIERAGFFADGGHLHHHVRENAYLLHRHVERVTDRHVVAHLVHGVGIDAA